MDHTKSNLLLVFITVILISIVGVGKPPQEVSDCISSLDIMVLNLENMATLDGADIYLNGIRIGTAPNGRLRHTLSNNKAPSRYIIEAKKESSVGCYSGKVALDVDCSGSPGISKSIEIYAERCRS